MRLHKLSTPFLLAKKNPALINTNDLFQVSPSKSRPIRLIFSTWIWCSRNDLVLVVENARSMWRKTHTMTQWRLVQQKSCPSKHQDPSFDQHFFASCLQVAFGLMQSALLLTGLERSIQNTRALVGKNCWCFPRLARLGVKHCVDVFLIPRWYFLYFLYLILGWLMMILLPIPWRRFCKACWKQVNCFSGKFPGTLLPWRGFYLGACLGMGTGPLLSSLSTATARLSHCQTQPGGNGYGYDKAPLGSRLTLLHGYDMCIWIHDNIQYTYYSVYTFIHIYAHSSLNQFFQDSQFFHSEGTWPRMVLVEGKS